MIAAGLEPHIRHGQPSFVGSRRDMRLVRTTARWRKGRRSVMVTLHMRIVCDLAFAFRLGRSTVIVVMALQTGSQPYRDRGSHHGIRAEKHQRSPETRNLFVARPTKPRPPCTHDYVALQQQHAYAGGLDRFTLTGVGPEGCARRT